MIKSTLEFVEKAKAVHGERYDYSESECLGESVFVCVKCRTHGPFKINVDSHLEGDICYKCKVDDWEKINRASSNFVRKAVLKHGEFYDYSEAVYTGSANKLKVKCPEHGAFELTASKHLIGNGCPVCNKILNTVYNTDSFVLKAKSIHGDLYDYDESVYVDLDDEIKIKCKTHGAFWKLANNHLSGGGCSHCGETEMTLQDFLKKAHEVHGDSYDYEDTILTSLYKKTKIKCRIHGEFEQVANIHLTGFGCALCIKKDANGNFVRKAKAVHGDKYNYSATLYTGSTNFVEIICPNHGSFFQRAKIHLSGSGCTECTIIKTPDFIKRAKLLHGDLYDYGNTVYKGSHEIVTIGCRIHGEFERIANHHLNGYGCKECVGIKPTTELFLNGSRYRGYVRVKLTTEVFKEKAQKLHGDLYDYENSVYKGSQEKVTIRCRVHGEFKQLAISHLYGTGCRECYRPSLTTDTFITKAKKVHGDRYGYDDVVYTGALKKVTILCKLHGKFEQIPTSHLSGKGCADCGHKKLTTEEFKEQAQLIHGDRYDYSDSICTGKGEKLKIKCRIHGEFEQKASSHLRGHGCRLCTTRKLSNDDFKAKAKLVHGEKYDYSETVYTNIRSTVIVKCRVHGFFEINAQGHLYYGSGCIECRTTKKTN